MKQSPREGTASGQYADKIFLQETIKSKSQREIVAVSCRLFALFRTICFGLPVDHGMAVDVEFLLAWLPALYLGRELSVKALQSLFIVAGLIHIAGAVEPFPAVKSSFLKLLYQQSGREYITLKAYIVLFAALVASCDIVVRISEVDDRIVAHLLSSGKGMLKQGFADARALIFREHAQRSHGEDILFDPVFIF